MMSSSVGDGEALELLEEEEEEEDVVVAVTVLSVVIPLIVMLVDELDLVAEVEEGPWVCPGVVALEVAVAWGAS